MSAPIEIFDHAMIAVSDLDRAAKQWSTLGFRMTPRGIHQGKGTANVCIMFSETYVELIGIIDQSLASGRLADRIATQGEGAIGLAYGSQDAMATHLRLSQANVAAEPPIPLERPLTLDGENHKVRFQNVMLPQTGLEPVIQFVCHHLTPELTRARREWQLHANGVTGLNEVIVCVDEPSKHAGLLRSMFADKAVRERKGELSALVEPITLRLCPFETIADRFPKAQLVKPGHEPKIMALCFDVTEPDAATTMWDMAGIDWHDGAGGAVYVAPKDATGVLVELSEG